MRKELFLLFFGLASLVHAQDRTKWWLKRSMVSFVSEAPMERIAAENQRSTGVLDRNTRAFAIQIPIVEFQGFNAPLQREHFNENYMVSGTFPHATFSGRIIESVDLTIPGTYAVRAKGDLYVHGVKRERIIPCKLVVTEEGIRVTSTFDVAVDEHDIRIPRVVQQKVAAVVQVKVDVLFDPSGAGP
ncbi:MAG: hypothetical protein JNM62_10335 [Flavobacteriales bacterium]|nr:hypothetical protein [Flavobacteriales bacterium]